MMTKEKNNLGLKIFSLFLAIFLWSYVMSEVNPEVPRNYKVELELSNSESLAREGLTVKDLEESTVTVKVSGKKSDIDEFNKESIKAIADLSGYEEGQKKVPIKVSLKNQMENIKIVDYEPKEVMITFDKIISEERPIKIRTVKELEDGYVLGEIDSKTEKVIIEGPRTWLNQVSEVVAFVDLEGRTKSFTINTPLRLLDSEGNDVSDIDKDPGSIDIDITILRSKTVDIKMNLDRNLPDEYDISQLAIAPNKVKLKGDESVLDIKQVETEPISVDELLNNDEVDVKLRLPEGIDVVDEDLVIKARLEKSEQNEREFSVDSNDIEVKNIDDNLEYSLGSPEIFDIILSGNKEQLNALESKDINLFIDLNNLLEGTHDVNIGYDVPNGFSVKSISPKTIEVKLKAKE